jgi:hypothetical protein
MTTQIKQTQERSFVAALLWMTAKGGTMTEVSGGDAGS